MQHASGRREILIGFWSGSQEGKGSLGRTRNREYNIKTDLREMGWDFSSSGSFLTKWF
jgi:hypothetical protein